MAKSPIWLAIDKINERLDKIEANFATPIPVPQPTPPIPPEVIPETQPREFPIPPDYIEAVDFTLNKSFGVKLEPLKDQPAFLFSILVPEKYSTLTPAQREMNTKDERPKVITYAEGTVGVQQWAERVFKNFNPDMQRLIVDDRPFATRPL